MELLITKKHSTMSFLQMQRYAALALTNLVLKKKVSCGTGSLRSVCIASEGLCNKLKLTSLQEFTMKCLLSSLLFPSLFQISNHLHFVRSINWLVLCALCQKSINRPRLIRFKRELCLEMPTKLVILSLMTEILSTLQAVCYQDMANTSPAINFMVTHCFLMVLLV